MARPPASEQVQVNFRMPADLKARIEAAAEANNRTTTAELVATLEEKYPAPADLWEEIVQSSLDRWSDLLVEMDDAVAGLRAAQTQAEIDMWESRLDKLTEESRTIQSALRDHLPNFAKGASDQPQKKRP